MIRAQAFTGAVAQRLPAKASTLAFCRFLALILAAFLVALLVLWLEARTAPFEADEADYIATSRYFGYLFLQHDVNRSEWGSNHWTRTQPPLTRYIIGGWLTTYGYDLEKLNQPYVSTASSFEVNRQKGRVPTDDVLARARQPMVILGAGAVVYLFCLGLIHGGTLAGVIVLALALSSSFLRYTLVHAWAEAPLAYFLLLALVVSRIGLVRVITGRRWAGHGIALGVSIGLASATKLTGLVAIPIVLGVALVIAVLCLWRGLSRTARHLIAWSVLASAIALAVFVVLNPYLWRGPISGLLGMLEERRDEMAFQQEQWPEYAVTNPLDRPWLTAVGSTRVGPWVDLPWVATPLGLGLGAVGLWTVLRSSNPYAYPRLMKLSGAMLAAWLAGYSLAVVTGLELSYPRYFLPTCLLLVPLMGVGAARLVVASAPPPLVSGAWSGR